MPAPSYTRRMTPSPSSAILKPANDILRVNFQKLRLAILPLACLCAFDGEDAQRAEVAPSRSGARRLYVQSLPCVISE